MLKFAISPEDEEKVIALVRDVARTEIMPRFRQLGAEQIGTKTSADDFVTEADEAAEQRLSNELSRIFPTASILGEEAVAKDPSVINRVDDDLCFVIDPIDGTWNYANGIANFGMILAVIAQGQVFWGLLYDPVLDDWVISRRGEGTWYVKPGIAPRRLVLKESGRAEPSGFTAKYMLLEDQSGVLGEYFRSRKALVRSLRCSCHEYRAMLFGAVDFNICAGLKVWDHAAGTLAISEAGGTCIVLPDLAYSARTSEGFMVVSSDLAECETLATDLSPILLDKS